MSLDLEHEPVFGPYAISDLSPMMLQWHQIKLNCPNALLLFRLGDFYEAFFDDAQLLATNCSVTLTKRQEVPMAGVPQHMLETYLERLIQKGFMVAIAEQTEDPKATKGIVKRSLARIESPATYVGPNEQKVTRKQFFASIYQLKQIYGVALVDLSTHSSSVFEVESKVELMDLLVQKQPKELLFEEKFHEKETLFLDDLKRHFLFRISLAKKKVSISTTITQFGFC